MTTIELIGERWEPPERRAGYRPGLSGPAIGVTLHFGPFAGWGAAGVIRADSWWRPLGYVVRDEDIVRAVGDIAPSVEGVEPGQTFILRVPPPPPRPWMGGPSAQVIAAPVGEPL